MWLSIILLSGVQYLVDSLSVNMLNVSTTLMLWSTYRHLDLAFCERSPVKMKLGMFHKVGLMLNLSHTISMNYCETLRVILLKLEKIKLWINYSSFVEV